VGAKKSLCYSIHSAFYSLLTGKQKMSPFYVVTFYDFVSCKKNNSFQGYPIGTYSICMVRIIYINLYALCLSIMFEQHFYAHSGTRAPGNKCCMLLKVKTETVDGKNRNSRRAPKKLSVLQYALRFFFIIYEQTKEL
jgi:hypothetical protein